MTWNAADATVRIGAGCRIGDVLTCLVPHGRTIVAGLSGLPGLGYVLTGGIGPLSRRFGLAVDQLKSITGVWGNGDPFQLEHSRHGGTAEWRGLCGAAPFLGVVTEVELFTQRWSPSGFIRTGAHRSSWWIGLRLQSRRKQGDRCSGTGVMTRL